MIRNYIKVAIRVLTKNGIYTTINVTGLTLGMLCCLLIMLWVQDEISFDKFHKNNDRLYLVVHRSEGGVGSNSPWALTPVLKKDFPEIEKASRICKKNLLIRHENQQFYEDIAFVDPDFLSMFSFPLLKGDTASALIAKQSVVISKEAALRYFQNENPIGKNLTLNLNTHLTVTGILKDFPKNSTHKFDMLVPIHNLGERLMTTWSSEAPAYVMLKENADVENLRTKMAGTTIKYDLRIKNRKIKNDLVLFSRTHLYGLVSGGTIKYVYLFSAIALIVLIIACINFINLITAQTSVRTKELGVRKVMGARKSQVILQFFGETTLVSIISFVLAFIIALIILPLFNIISEKQLSIDFSDPLLLFGSLGIILITAIIASSYPALMFSSFQPIRILKESIFTGRKKDGVRWTLVVVQFSVSVILMVVTLTMNRQFNYIQNKKLGFNKEQVVSIQLDKNLRERYKTIKNHLLQFPEIKHVTSSTLGPNAIWYSNPVYWEGGSSENYESMSYVTVDESYLETFEIELAQGRNFSKDLASDRKNYIVNEAAVEFMQMENPIGKMFSIWQGEGKIIGVVKNFHSRSLHSEIGPIVMTQNVYTPVTKMYIRIQPENITASLKTIENVFKEFNPEYPFEYEFFDEVFARDYRNEVKTKSLFQYFSLLAIFISCIGLYGLVAFVTQRLKKSISIRKIAGAKVIEIMTLVFRGFTKWLIVAIAIACPIAYFAMNKWLQNFAYKTELSWWIFALAGLIALGIALLTVSWQSWKAARRNPVEALRYE